MIWDYEVTDPQYFQWFSSLYFFQFLIPLLLSFLFICFDPSIHVFPYIFFLIFLHNLQTQLFEENIKIIGK